MPVPLISRILLGLILGAAAAGKWANFSWFAHAVAKYDLIPAELARFTAVMIVSSESAFALLLLAGIGQPYTGWAAGAFVALLSTAVVISVTRGHTHQCGCSGSPGEGVSWGIVRRNAGLVGLAALSSMSTTAPSSWVDASVAILVASIIVFVWPSAGGLRGATREDVAARDA